jgi:hypothetical protein
VSIARANYAPHVSVDHGCQQASLLSGASLAFASILHIAEQRLAMRVSLPASANGAGLRHNPRHSIERVGNRKTGWYIDQLSFRKSRVRLRQDDLRSLLSASITFISSLIAFAISAALGQFQQMA